MDRDKSLRAVFAPLDQSRTFAGDVRCKRECFPKRLSRRARSSTQTLSLTPLPGYALDHWSYNNSTENPVNLTVSDDLWVLRRHTCRQTTGGHHNYSYASSAFFRGGIPRLYIAFTHFSKPARPSFRTQTRSHSPLPILRILCIPVQRVPAHPPLPVQRLAPYL